MSRPSLERAVEVWRSPIATYAISPTLFPGIGAVTSAVTPMTYTVAWAPIRIQYQLGRYLACAYGVTNGYNFPLKVEDQYTLSNTNAVSIFPISSSGKSSSLTQKGRRPGTPPSSVLAYAPPQSSSSTYRSSSASRLERTNPTWLRCGSDRSTQAISSISRKLGRLRSR